MTFYQLAFRYLKRKRAKTILLLFVFLFINSMILSTNMILGATEDSKSSIQEKANSKVAAEIINEKDKITENDIEQISHLDEVVSVNRLSSDSAFPTNFNAVTNSTSAESDNLKISLLSYDDLENDSAFFEQRYRLTDGNFIGKDNPQGIVINSLLADANGLKLGDRLSFETAGGQTGSAFIIGLFISGSESKQTNSISAVNRIENQIFIDNTTFSGIFGNEGFYKAAVYTKSPEQLDDLAAKLKSILHEKVEMATSDLLYQQMEAPLNQLIKVMNLMLALTLITGTAVISLLLCMWMRTRQKETAIFISLGKPKVDIYFQIFLETFVVFIFSLLGACVLGSFTANLLQILLSNSENTDVTLHVVLNYKDIIVLFGIGSCIVLIAVACSLMPVLRTNPKDTLSKMEG